MKQLIRKSYMITILAALLGSLVFLDACSSKSGTGAVLMEEDAIAPVAEGYENVTPDYIFTYAENQNEDYPTTQGAREFARLVNEKSQGRIRVRVYANAQLGDEASAVQQVQYGGIDFVRASLAAITDYSEETIVLMMPYLYQSPGHMWKVLDGEIGQEVMNSFTGSGLVPLAWYDAGVRSFYTRKPVSSIKGMKGLKIRVQPSSLMEDLVEELGAGAVPINYEDVYDALQTGTVDGAENNWSSYEAMDHYKVAPYFLADEHSRTPELQLASEQTMQQLSAQDRQMIRECAQESAVLERELWQETEESSRQKVLDEGCREISLSDEEKQKFKDAVRPLYEQYCGGYMEFIHRIEALGVQ